MHLLKAYLQYLIFSGYRKGHDIHSPFTYHFVTQVLFNKQKTEALKFAENEREKLLQSKKIIWFNDFGRGQSEYRYIKNIARNSLSKPKDCQMLSRLIKFLTPESCIELGTSLGITTLYLSNSCKKVYTIEGCLEVAQIASCLFVRNEQKNIELIVGTFDEHLPTLVNKIEKPFIAFIDGNHSLSATLKYFHLLKNASQTQNIIVLHDIHKNKEMERSWQTIIDDKLATLTIDLFTMGLVFINFDLIKQHYIINY